MKSINIHEAKTHLSRLLDEVQSGESVIIAKAGKPIAKLVPFTSMQSERKAGVLAGEIWEADDAWEVDEELLSQMEGEPLVYEVKGGVQSVAEDETAYGEDV